MKNIGKRKGITLIALVITIIILLILAGITIMQLIGENSLMARAKEAKQKETEAEIRETVQLMLYEYGVRIDIWTHLTRECIINYVH